MSLTGGTSLDRVPVTDLEQDPADPGTIYAATFGRGVWRWRFDQPPACGGGPE